MKHTELNNCNFMTYLWEDGDWSPNGTTSVLTIRLHADNKMIGYQVYRWDGSLRTPLNIPGYFKNQDGSNVLELIRGHDESWAGCVTVFYSA